MGGVFSSNGDEEGEPEVEVRTVNLGDLGTIKAYLDDTLMAVS